MFSLTGAAKTQVVTVAAPTPLATKMAFLLQSECRAPKFSQSRGSQQHAFSKHHILLDPN